MFDTGEVNDAPRPVMTFRIAGDWLAVAVEQMDRIVVTDQIWPVPMVVPEYLGIMDDGPDVIPVLRLSEGRARPDSAAADEQLVAILHVRGESVGLAIDGAGHVYHDYRPHPAGGQPPDGLEDTGAELARSPEGDFWLVDPDRLWQAPERAAALTPFRS